MDPARQADFIDPARQADFDELTAILHEKLRNEGTAENSGRTTEALRRLQSVYAHTITLRLAVQREQRATKLQFAFFIVSALLLALLVLGLGLLLKADPPAAAKTSAPPTAEVPRSGVTSSSFEDSGDTFNLGADEPRNPPTRNAPAVTPPIPAPRAGNSPAATPPGESPPAATQPNWVAVLPLWLGIILAMGVALYALLRGGKSGGPDAFTAILAAAIGSIGGVFAFSKAEKVPIPASWGDAVHAAVLATLVCVGLAALRPEKATDPPTGKAGRVGRGLVAAAVVLFSLFALLVPSVVPFIRTRSTASLAQHIPPVAAPSLHLRWDRLGTVGPFPLGVADPKEPARRGCASSHGRTQLEASVNKLIEHLRLPDVRKPEALLIVASADRSTLIPGCRYTSNRALAEARGQWVASQLTSVLGSISYAVIPSGASQFGPSVDASEDRSVVVLGSSLSAVATGPR